MSGWQSRGAEAGSSQIASFSFYRSKIAIGALDDGGRFRGRSDPSGKPSLYTEPGSEATLQRSWREPESAPADSGSACAQKNSASRWRFRPLLRLTLRLPPTRPPVEPRPNLAPCSLQEGSYGLARGASRAGELPHSQIAKFFLSNGLFAYCVKRSGDRFRCSPGRWS